MFFKAWFQPNNRIQLAKIEPTVVTACLVIYPEHVIFEADVDPEGQDYYFQVWFKPTGGTQVKKIDEERVDYCLEWYPDQPIFLASLTPSQI